MNPWGLFPAPAHRSEENGTQDCPGVLMALREGAWGARSPQFTDRRKQSAGREFMA